MTKLEELKAARDAANAAADDAWSAAAAANTAANDAWTAHNDELNKENSND